MSNQIIKLHGLIQYYRALNAWGMAESLEKILMSLIERANHEKSYA